MTRKQDRFSTQAQQQAQVNGRTLRGRQRPRSSGMQELLAGCIGTDFTPADEVRYAHHLFEAGAILEQRGLSPALKAKVESLMTDLPS